MEYDAKSTSLTDNKEKAEPQNCWEFWNCEIKARKECPAFFYDGGRECWMVAGSYNKEPKCPKVVNKTMQCWDCGWFKKLNPDFE